MTEAENEDMTKQLGDVLTRLEGRLDDMEKGEKPAFLEGKDEKKDKDDEKKSEDAVEESAEVEKSAEYSDVISSDYLNWMEDTLKSGGVDTIAAREHFDNLEKANLGSTPEELEAYHTQRTGQVKGRVQEGGKPSTGAIGKTTGSGKVEKADFIDPATLSDSDIEAAYEVYKAAALENELRGSLETQFADRYAHERQTEIAKAEAAAFDARSPLEEIQKSIAALGERIDSIGTPVAGEEIQKSEDAAEKVVVPSTQDLATMSWDEVHNLANKAFDN